MAYEASLHIRRQEIEKMIGEKKEILMEAASELSVFGPAGDMALELYEREKNAEIIELLEIELARVNEALQKCAAGGYGICEVCGGAIEDERLQRRVNTALCQQCDRTRSNLLH